MIILGINFGHNSSIAVIKDGKILGAIEEEKLSRLKDDFYWPEHSIERLFNEHSIKRNQVDIVSIQDDTSTLLGKFNLIYRFKRKLFYKYIDFFYRSLAYFRIIKTNKFYDNESLSRLIYENGFNNAKVEYFDHHLSHAASAFYTAPFISDIVITCDGFGGEDSFNFYKPTNEGLDAIKRNSHNVSVGQFYSAITQLLGYKPNRHEGKITGLAAYGKPTELVGVFHKLWRYENDKLIRFPFGDVESNEYKIRTQKELNLKEKISVGYTGNKILNDYTFNNYCLIYYLKAVTKHFSPEDIAYACQKVSEDIIINEFKRVYDAHFSKSKIKVSLAGGVFANVRINQLIYELEFVENIFVQPAMPDSGLALGNAILSTLKTDQESSKINCFIFKNTYLGPNFDKSLTQFIKGLNDDNIIAKKMTNPALEVATLLNENKIIGFWSGCMEWGPRALGSRSILLNTFDKSVNDTLNKRLDRTEFMPFAPVVLDNMAKIYFPKYKEQVPAANYMTITYDTAEKYHDQLQAVVHIDGTARPQIIKREDNEYYYDILSEFHKISGCGALVNTSFNAHEEPIVSNPDTALNALKSGRVDLLVMNDYIIKKV